MADDRNRLRGVVAAPEKVVVPYALEEKLAPLMGLSPGILLGVVVDMLKLVCFGVLEGASPKSFAVKLCESLLEGPWGRSIIFLAASCDSEARLAGLSRDAVDTTLEGDVFAFDSGFCSSALCLASVGSAELRPNKLKPPKMPRLLAGDSMTEIAQPRPKEWKMRCEGSDGL